MNLPVQGERVYFRNISWHAQAAYARAFGRRHLVYRWRGEFRGSQRATQCQCRPCRELCSWPGRYSYQRSLGLFYWNEFQNPSPKVKQLLLAMLVLFVAGLALVSIAPLR